MPGTNRMLIQVLPQLKPTRCGVSDQAVLLAERLRSTFRIESAFIVLNSEERCSVAYPVIYCKPAQLLDSCLSLSGKLPAALLVHVSGYGYSADGAPRLLGEALARVKSDGRFQIGAYFHELFATGKPWESAFWYSRLQKKAAYGIAESCDLLVTNTSYHANWLTRETTKRSGAPVQLLPVFSAAGEAQSPIPASQRKPTMVVFGLPASRLRAYSKLASIAGILGKLGINEIVDIGAEAAVPSALNGVPVRPRGALGVAELGDEFSQAKFGFLPHDAMYLAKSSIFAAYCAQGTIPVIATSFEGEVDGLTDGVHLLSPKTADEARASGLDGCSGAAWRWYSEHRIQAHAATYAGWMDRQR